MAFNRQAFTQAAKAMGYTDQEIESIATMREAQDMAGPSVQQQKDVIDLEKAKLEYNKAAAQPIMTPQEKADFDFKNLQREREDAAKRSQLQKIWEEAQKREEAKKPLQGLTDIMQQLKQDTADVGVVDVIAGKAGLSSKASQFETKKALASQYLAKLVEKNRISDKDRDFYIDKIMNIDPIGLQEPKNQQIDTILNTVIKLAGYSPEDFKVSQKTIKEPLKETKQNSSDPNAPSLSGLATNAGKDIYNIVNSTLNIPYAIKEDILNRIRTGQTIDPMHLITAGIINVGKGLINEYNEALGRPLEGGDILGRITKRAYEKPVTTALDVLPFIKAGKIGTAGKLGEGAELPNIVSKEAGMIPSAAGSIAEQMPKIEAPTVTTGVAARTFKQIFNVPAKLAERYKLNQTAKELVDQGVWGSYDDLKNIATTVTGNNGELTKVVRDIIADIGKPIDTSMTLKSASNLAERIGVADAKVHVQTIQNIIGKKMGTEPINMLNPLEAMDAVRELEQIGNQYANVGYNKFNPRIVEQQISKLYLSTADELETSINNSIKANVDINKYKTPEVIQKLQRISPKLAEDFRNAKTMQEIRAIQAPYVRLNKLLDITENAAQSPFSNLSKQVVSRTTGAAAGTILGGPIGGVVGALTGPAIEGIAEGILPKIQTGAAQLLKKGQKIIKK